MSSEGFDPGSGSVTASLASNSLALTMMKDTFSGEIVSTDDGSSAGDSVCTASACMSVTSMMVYFAGPCARYLRTDLIAALLSRKFTPGSLRQVDWGIGPADGGEDTTVLLIEINARPRRPRLNSPPSRGGKIGEAGQ